jgi:hypothetical protein
VNISFQLKITEQRLRAEGRGHKETKIFEEGSYAEAEGRRTNTDGDSTPSDLKHPNTCFGFQFAFRKIASLLGRFVSVQTSSFCYKAGYFSQLTLGRGLKPKAPSSAREVPCILGKVGVPFGDKGQEFLPSAFCPLPEAFLVNLPDAIGLLAPHFSYQKGHRFFSFARSAREKGVLVKPPDFSYALAMK